MSSFLKCLKKIVKECDCFGTFVTFRINRDNELKSLFGGCSTIIYSILAVIYVSYMSYHFSNYQLSIVNYQLIVIVGLSKSGSDSTYRYVGFTVSSIGRF